MKTYNVYEIYNEKGEYQGYCLESEIEWLKNGLKAFEGWTYKKSQRVWG